MNNTLTITVLANITANYGESLGNISTVQKFHKNGRVYAMRSKESLKEAVMSQSGFYSDVVTVVNAAAQKLANAEHNAATNRAYEAGYMTTGTITHSRKSSFVFSDAVSITPFVVDYRFHNNLYLAAVHAKANGFNLQEQVIENDIDDVDDIDQDKKKDKKKENKCGLMPYQYEFDKGIKVFSFTLNLDEIGVDENFKDIVVTPEEKAYRVNTLLETIGNCALRVKASLDNAGPLFIVGGLTKYRTHVFENLVNVKNNKIVISRELKNKMKQGYSCGIVQCGIFDNEDEVVDELCAVSVDEFFENLRYEVNKYYGI